MQIILWLTVALAAGIVEACTTALVSVWITVGAVCAACGAAFGAGTTVQTVIFLAVSLVLLICTAPLGKKFRMAKKIPTNADMLIGCVGVITEDVDPIGGHGEVRVNGRAWSVRVRGDGKASVGDKVIIEEIVGAHLVASVIDEEK